MATDDKTSLSQDISRIRCHITDDELEEQRANLMSAIASAKVASDEMVRQINAAIAKIDKDWFLHIGEKKTIRETKRISVIQLDDNLYLTRNPPESSVVSLVSLVSADKPGLYTLEPVDPYDVAIRLGTNKFRSLISNVLTTKAQHIQEILAQVETGRTLS